MITNAIFDHLIVASLGWLIGTIAGIALGYTLATLSFRLQPPGTRQTSLTVLIPWRTVIAGLLLFNWIPLIPMRLFGLRIEMGITSVTFAIFLCAAGLTVQTMRFTPTAIPVILRTLSGVRSLAVLSVVVATHYGFFGGGGLGWVIQEDINLLDYQHALVAGGWIVGIALALDLAVGGVQFVIGSKMTTSPRPVQSEAA